MSVRVVIFDDQEDARTALARRLQRAPQIDLVGTASDLEAAGALLSGEGVDLVLLTLHQQHGHWLDCCRRLATLTQAPVVVLASFMTPDLWNEAKRGGAADYLLKHIDSARLSREIVRLAGRYGRRPGGGC